ncbi:YmfQ family protein [Lysobacter sp. LF1]|uniref:YmfQ family protein n=1 Tax=Lysobacter stagni TaxID=3045172 RepID=A0ABT6XKP3_9GAMM|nr:YmfQ family protein [Lysobacter sp. LF1]MDI9240729.1 YmfQ family protein [Lysobacter sp. LF1]
MIRTHHHYRQLLKALLPPGRALPAESDSQLHALLDGLAPEFARIDARAMRLIVEAMPDTTEELLPDWERVLGLPDGCLPRDDSLESRRKALLAKLVAQGGQSAGYFLLLAESLGYPGARVQEFKPFTCNSRCNEPLYSHVWRFAWLIEVPKLPPGNEARDRTLECLLNRYKPAHTHLIVRYAVRLFVLPDYTDPNYIEGE